MSYRIRTATEDEVPYVISSWINSALRPGSGWERLAVERAAIHRSYAPHVKAWVPSHLAHVRVLELDDVPGEVIGWAASGRHTLHFVYVKQSYRGRGVGRALVDEVRPLIVTNTTRDWKRFALRQGLSPKFDPFVFLTAPCGAWKEPA